MNARNETLLEQAKQQGYLLMRYGYNNTLKAHYFEWCRSQKIPAIYVWFHDMSASFETNTEPVYLGYYESDTDGDLFDCPSLTPTPELKERCRALSARCLASSNSKRARTARGAGMMARYIGKDMAIEAAKELWQIWQEAKQHLVFVPD
jgi:hypothetical protein